jgi:hypothetical protein
MLGLLFVSSLVLIFLLGLPTLTYFYARHLGRNPRKWFLIGLLLPGIATIILSLLPDRSERPETDSQYPNGDRG